MPSERTLVNGEPFDAAVAASEAAGWKESERTADLIRSQVGRSGHAGDYGQVVASILTASTFSFGAFAADAAGDWVVLGGGSTVPAISTLCPTCGESFASSASSRYSLATAVLGGADVVAVVVVLIAALVKRNFVSFAPRVAPAVPLVPVGAC